MKSYPLEPTGQEMRRLVDEAMRRIIEHIESLPSQPAFNTEDAADYARTLIEAMPEQGSSYEALLDHLFEDCIPRSFNTASPGYFAYIPGGGIFHAAVADLIADSVNRYVGVNAAAPALVQLETNVVRWFCEIVRSEEHTSELQSLAYLVCRLLLEKKKKKQKYAHEPRDARCENCSGRKSDDHRDAVNSPRRAVDCQVEQWKRWQRKEAG